MGFGVAPRRCGIHSKPQPLLQKTYLSYAFKTLATCTRSCLRAQDRACVHMQWLTYVGYDPHTQAEGYFGQFISKKRVFLI